MATEKTQEKEAKSSKSEKSEKSEKSAEDMSWDELAPTPEPGVSLLTSSEGLTISPVETLGHDDVDVDAVAFVLERPAEGEDGEVIENEPATSLQVVSGSGGAIVFVNGTGYGFNNQGVAALSRCVDQAVASVSL